MLLSKYTHNYVTFCLCHVRNCAINVCRTRETISTEKCLVNLCSRLSCAHVLLLVSNTCAIRRVFFGTTWHNFVSVRLNQVI